LGRATGEGMAVYWPTVATNPESSEEDKWMAERLNALPKIIFSKTISNINWTNARIANDIIEEVKELKKEPGKDIMIYGGAGIVSSFIKENLIDEYYLYIHPVVIGKGKAIFPNVKERLNLKLITTIQSTNGVVILHYEPIKKEVRPSANIENMKSLFNKEPKTIKAFL
jgi:dihydrofolate reductase